MHRLLTVVPLVSLALFLGASSALAANHTVSPLAFNLNVEKRDIIEETITLTNTSGQQLRLYASVHEVSVDGSGVVEAFVEPSMVDRTSSPTSWISVERGRIELAPGATREIPLRITMNPNTKPGDYSVFIGFAEASNQPEAVRAVMAGRAPGTLVNLVVDTKQDQFLRLARFSVDRFVTGRGESEVSYTLANPGDVDVVHQGEVIFYDTRGEEVAAVPLNPEGTVLPRGEELLFSVSVPDTLTIGKYKAFLSVEYGEHLTDSINDTTYFYVTPLRELSILFVVVLALAVGVTLYVHRRYDVAEDDHGAEPVALYVRSGQSQSVPHDIDLRPQSGKTPPDAPAA